jgi:Putative MetA-pathway of phenol degradation
MKRVIEWGGRHQPKGLRLAVFIGLMQFIAIATAAMPQDDKSDRDARAGDAPVLVQSLQSTSERVALASKDRDGETAPTTFQVKPAIPPPPTNASTPRRRGSMVGYIEEAVVGTKVRVRFDTARHDFEPDRAEFFYAKCGCYRDLTPSDPNFDPKAPGPRPGAANDLNFQQLYIFGEYAMNERVSAFGELPTRWLQPQSFIAGTGFPNQRGIGDLRFGVKAALLSTPEQVVTVRAQFYSPTGDAKSGLGTNHWSLEPAVLYYQQLSDRVVVESQLGIWFPFEGSDGVPIASSDKFSGNIFFYGIGPSFEVYRGNRVRFAPIVELVGWRVLSGFQTVGGDASGTNIANIKIGARTSWDTAHSFYVGYGHAITDAGWYKDIVRFEYRYSF